MKMTIADFAKAQNVPHNVANGVMTFLVTKGHATKLDEMRPTADENGGKKRGRPSAVFEMPETLTLKLG